MFTVAPSGITNRAIVSVTSPELKVEDIDTGMVAADDALANAYIMFLLLLVCVFVFVFVFVCVQEIVGYS